MLLITAIVRMPVFFAAPARAHASTIENLPEQLLSEGMDPLINSMKRFKHNQF